MRESRLPVTQMKLLFTMYNTYFVFSRTQHYKSQRVVFFGNWTDICHISKAVQLTFDTKR